MKNIKRKIPPIIFAMGLLCMSASLSGAASSPLTPWKDATKFRTELKPMLDEIRKDFINKPGATATALKTAIDNIITADRNHTATNTSNAFDTKIITRDGLAVLLNQISKKVGSVTIGTDIERQALKASIEKLLNVFIPDDKIIAKHYGNQLYSAVKKSNTDLKKALQNLVSGKSSGAPDVTTLNGRFTSYGLPEVGKDPDAWVADLSSFAVIAQEITDAKDAKKVADLSAKYDTEVKLKTAVEAALNTDIPNFVPKDVTSYESLVKNAKAKAIVQAHYENKCNNAKFEGLSNTLTCIQWAEYLGLNLAPMFVAIKPTTVDHWVAFEKEIAEALDKSVNPSAKAEAESKINAAKKDIITLIKGEANYAAVKANIDKAIGTTIIKGFVSSDQDLSTFKDIVQTYGTGMQKVDVTVAPMKTSWDALDSTLQGLLTAIVKTVSAPDPEALAKASADAAVTAFESAVDTFVAKVNAAATKDLAKAVTDFDDSLSTKATNALNNSALNTTVKGGLQTRFNDANTKLTAAKNNLAAKKNQQDDNAVPTNVSQVSDVLDGSGNVKASFIKFIDSIQTLGDLARLSEIKFEDFDTVDKVQSAIDDSKMKGAIKSSAKMKIKQK